MATDKQKTAEGARKKILFALAVGLLVPILTVIPMYYGYALGKHWGKPFDALLALLGAFGGFAVGAVIVWKIMVKISELRMS